VPETSIRGTVPAGAAGTVPLIVMTPGGTSAPLSFTYTTAHTVTWVGPSSGDWATASNWSGGALPGSGDDVVIGAGNTVTHSTGSDTIHQLNGAGALVLSGGTLTVNALCSFATLTVSGGNLQGTAALTVTSSFTWSQGQFANGGSLTIASTATGTLSSQTGRLTLQSYTVNNAGSVSWTVDGQLQFSNGVWNNLSGSLFLVQAGFSAQVISGTFSNAGTFRKTGTGSTTFGSGVSFNNTGTVDIQAGSLTLSAGTSSGSVTVASGSTLNLSGYTLTSNSSISGAGSVAFTGGTSTLAGTISASGGVSIASAATVNTSGSATLNTSLTNSGTLAVAGSGAAGTLTINGNYTQNAGAFLNMEIGGTTAGSQYDQLVISGQANLGGTLNVSYLGGYTPPSGSSYALLTYGSHSGTFSSVSGTSMTPQYNSGNFSLLALRTPDEEADEGPAADEPERPGRRAPAEAVVSRPVPSAEAVGVWWEPAEVRPVADVVGEMSAGHSTGGLEPLVELPDGWDADPLDLLAWTDLLALPVRLLDELFAQLV
jgi:hypothetical protein